MLFCLEADRHALVEIAMVPRMRVVDLDRDMRDVIPTGTSRDSEYLFDRMTFRTLDLAAAGPGRTVLDVASGLGQDARAGKQMCGAAFEFALVGTHGAVIESLDRGVFPLAVLEELLQTLGQETRV